MSAIRHAILSCPVVELLHKETLLRVNRYGDEFIEIIRSMWLSEDDEWLDPIREILALGSTFIQEAIIQTEEMMTGYATVTLYGLEPSRRSTDPGRLRQASAER